MSEKAEKIRVKFCKSKILFEHVFLTVSYCLSQYKFFIKEFLIKKGVCLATTPSERATLKCIRNVSQIHVGL